MPYVKFEVLIQLTHLSWNQEQIELGIYKKISRNTRKESNFLFHLYKFIYPCMIIIHNIGLQVFPVIGFSCQYSGTLLGKPPQN